MKATEPLDDAVRRIGDVIMCGVPILLRGYGKLYDCERPARFWCCSPNGRWSARCGPHGRTSRHQRETWPENRLPITATAEERAKHFQNSVRSMGTKRRARAE